MPQLTRRVVFYTTTLSALPHIEFKQTWKGQPKAKLITMCDMSVNDEEIQLLSTIINKETAQRRMLHAMAYEFTTDTYTSERLLQVIMRHIQNNTSADVHALYFNNGAYTLGKNKYGRRKLFKV